MRWTDRHQTHCLPPLSPLQISQAEAVTKRRRDEEVWGLYFFMKVFRHTAKVEKMLENTCTPTT